MPQEIDQEKIEGSDLTSLDINNPPTRSIPHQEYPRMVYLHPKDKTKEGLHKVVKTAEEHDAATKKGYKSTPHVPIEAPEDLSDYEATEYETGRKPTDIDEMTKADLVALARERGISIDAQESKATILAAIKNATEKE